VSGLATFWSRTSHNELTSLSHPGLAYGVQYVDVGSEAPRCSRANKHPASQQRTSKARNVGEECASLLGDVPRDSGNRATATC
jgi:hypothetical protein